MNKFSCSLSGTWVVTVCQGTHWVNYAFYFTKVATLKALNHPAKTRTQGKCQNDYNKKKKKLILWIVLVCQGTPWLVGLIKLSITLQRYLYVSEMSKWLSQENSAIFFNNFM